MGKEIWVLNHGLANGGTDTFTIELVKGLKERGYDVTVVMAVDPDAPTQPRENIVRAIDVPLYRTKDPVGICGMWLHAYRLYKLLKQHRPDVFHANMDLFNGVNMLAARLARVPVRVCHSHNTQSQYEANTGRHFLVNRYRNLMKRLCRRFANRYCGCSSAAMAYLFDNWWRTDPNAAVIYNGIDLKAYMFSEDKKTDAQERPRRIITIGRIAQQKNPFFILEIAEKLSRVRTDFELLWVGEGEMGDCIRAAAHDRRLDTRIRFLGVRRDIPQLLRSADVFILPSLFEGLGIVLIEAQAAGVYTLASDRVPAEADCGLCEFLPIEDASVWAARIADIFTHGAPKEPDAALLRRFDASRMIDSIERVYFPTC